MDGIKRKAAWLLPVFIEGSGGHRTIFQNIQCLADHGYECDVYVEDQGQVSSAQELKKLAEKLFGECQCRYYLGFRMKKQYDIVFATAWHTAKIVHDDSGTGKKAYFIQDDEPRFYPAGERYLMARDSYCYGLHPITIGRWLSQKMMQGHPMPSQYFDFCADTAVYKNLHLKRKRKAICFIYQPEKPRRCPNLGIAALGIVKYLRPETTIYLYGSKVKGRVWFEHKNLGILPVEKCNGLYNRCTVGLCISASNPSRVPFEMMAAGLPVVDIYMENNLYDMPSQGVSLAHYTPESIAQALLEILDDSAKRGQMAQAGQAYMKERTLAHGMGQFYQAVENILQGTCLPKRDISRLYGKEAVKAGPITGMLTEREWDMLEEKNKGHSWIRWIGWMKGNRHIANSQFARNLYWKLRRMM